MNKPTRVAFLSEHASPVALLGGEDAGGQNVYVDEVSRNLGKLGYAVDVFTRCGRPDTPAVVDWASNVRVINVRVGPPTFLLKDQLWPLMPAFRDAILTFSQETGTTYDLIHSNFWMSGWVGAELGERLNIPVAHIFHALGKTKQQHQGTADTSPTGRIAVEVDVIQRVDRLIAQCPSERTELVDDYGADPSQVAIIPSAVNVRRFRPMPQAEARHWVGIDPGVFLIVYVGRMVPRKDVRNIVRAVALLKNSPALPPVHFLVVGGESEQPDPAVTPEIGEVQKLAEALGVADRVHLIGSRPPKLLRYYYGAADVVVTTPWYEPFGLTPLEAMACGRPVLGAAVGGITYTIKNGQTGFLVPPRNPAALAERLEQLRADRVLCRRLGLAARTRVEHQFTWEIVGRRTAALYQLLLQNKQRADTKPAAPYQRPRVSPAKSASMD
jgi:D-inositol-3-phosphate glycosyltransferase